MAADSTDDTDGAVSMIFRVIRAIRGCLLFIVDQRILDMFSGSV
jgi:hypothetical protein